MIEFLKNIFRIKEHAHDYKIPITVQGIKFLKCTVCNMCDPIEDPERSERIKEVLRRADELPSRVPFSKINQIDKPTNILIMEKELYVLNRNMKIVEEVKQIEVGQIVTINGKEVEVGKGNQHILQLNLNDESIARVTFFSKNDEKPEIIEETRITYLKILCNVFVKPLSKLLKELKDESIFEIGACLKIGK